jgi:hypothetical protein
MPKTIGYIQGIPVIVPDDWETRTLGPNIINIPPERGMKIIYEDEDGAINGSPFGPYHHNPIVVPKGSTIPKDKDLPKSNYWMYEIISSSNGLELLRKYQDKEYSYIINKSDNTDQQVDMTIFIEKDDATNIFGTTCLVRINQALREYIIDDNLPWRNAAWLANWIMKTYDKTANTIFEDKLVDAINYELNAEVNSLLGLLIAKFIDFTYGPEISFIRDTKLQPNRWQSKEEDYHPILKLTTNSKIIKEDWEDYKAELKDTYKTLQTLKVASKLIDSNKYAQLIDNLVAQLDGVIAFIDTIVDGIEFVETAIQFVNAFICGVINEVLEIAAATIDLIVLASTLYFDKIERIHISELLENTIEEYINQPERLVNKAKQLWEQLQLKYNNAQNTDEVAYLLGEDVVEVVMWIDVINGVTSAISKVGKKGYEGLMAWLKKLSTKSDEAAKIANAIKPFVESEEFLVIFQSVKASQKLPLLLSVLEEAMLKFWTTNAGYKKFNIALSKKLKLTENFILQEKVMNEALNKLPISEYNSSQKLLYRIENLTEAEIKGIYKEGTVITKEGFTAATYSEEAIINAMRNRSYTVMIRIEGKKGRLIEEISTLQKEKEILFKSKTKFFVKKIYESANPGDDYMSKIITIWIKEI